MKKFSIKKIVLSSIGLFGSLMLLIGLAFNVLAYDMGVGGMAGDALADTLQTEANGFTFLSFALPKFLRTSVLSYVNEDFCSTFELLLGITSLLSLLLALGGIALITLGFFRFNEKKNQKTISIILVFGAVVSLLHGILAIVFASSVQSELDAMMKKLSGSLGATQTSIGKFTTVAYLSCIFQVVCFVAYVICSKKIKAAQPKAVVATNEKAVDGGVKAEKVKEDPVDKAAALCELIKAEIEIANLLTEYKALYDTQIISTSDYIDKKVKLLHYSEKRVKGGVAALLNKCSFAGVVNAERQVLEVLRVYAKLLKDTVISDADFVEKKVALLSYVIN